MRIKTKARSKIMDKKPMSHEDCGRLGGNKTIERYGKKHFARLSKIGRDKKKDIKEEV